MARAKRKGAAPRPSAKAPAGGSTGSSRSSRSRGPSAPADPVPGSESGEPPGVDPGRGASFEARLARIEHIVDRLDQGELTLEESLSVFEEGVALTKQCWSELEAAEQRVEILVREGGAWSERPFDAPEADELEEREEEEEY